MTTFVDRWCPRCGDFQQYDLDDLSAGDRPVCHRCLDQGRGTFFMVEDDPVLGYMHLESNEEEATADCGCILRRWRDEDCVDLILCETHRAVPLPERAQGR